MSTITPSTHMNDAEGYARYAIKEMARHGRATWQNAKLHDENCRKSALVILDAAEACVNAAIKLAQESKHAPSAAVPTE